MRVKHFLFNLFLSVGVSLCVPITILYIRRRACAPCVRMCIAEDAYTKLVNDYEEKHHVSIHVLVFSLLLALPFFPLLLYLHFSLSNYLMETRT